MAFKLFDRLHRNGEALPKPDYLGIQQQLEAMPEGTTLVFSQSKPQNPEQSSNQNPYSYKVIVSEDGLSISKDGLIRDRRNVQPVKFEDWLKDIQIDGWHCQQAPSVTIDKDGPKTPPRTPLEILQIRSCIESFNSLKDHFIYGTEPSMEEIATMMSSHNMETWINPASQELFFRIDQEVVLRYQPKPPINRGANDGLPHSTDEVTIEGLIGQDLWKQLSKPQNVSDLTNLELNFFEESQSQLNDLLNSYFTESLKSIGINSRPVSEGFSQLLDSNALNSIAVTQLGVEVHLQGLDDSDEQYTILLPFNNLQDSSKLANYKGIVLTDLNKLFSEGKIPLSLSRLVALCKYLQDGEMPVAPAVLMEFGDNENEIEAVIQVNDPYNPAKVVTIFFNTDGKLRFCLDGKEQITQGVLESMNVEFAKKLREMLSQSGDTVLGVDSWGELREEVINNYLPQGLSPEAREHAITLFLTNESMVMPGSGRDFNLGIGPSTDNTMIIPIFEGMETYPIDDHYLKMLIEILNHYQPASDEVADGNFENGLQAAPGSSVLVENFYVEYLADVTQGMSLYQTALLFQNLQVNGFKLLPRSVLLQELPTSSSSF